MKLLLFDVKCELRTRSLTEISDGEVFPTEVTFYIHPAAPFLRPCSVRRNELDPTFLTRACNLHRYGTITVTITEEWFSHHLSTWREGLIEMALQQPN